MPRHSETVTRVAASTCALLLSLGYTVAAAGLPEIKTLDNGLTVVLLEDHTLPQVAVSLWVHAGSKNETESSAGYAHFLEHLLQRGTDTGGPYEFNRLANRRGGTLSVRSNYDRTYITLTGIASTLDDLLDTAAAMAFRATLQNEQIDRELGTLNQEMRTYYALPSSVAFLETMRYAFPEHPYRFATLGSVGSMGKLSSEPLRGFYRNLYVPNNMALAVAGDFEPQRVVARVKATFGTAARSATLPPQPAPPAGFAGHDDIEKPLGLRENWTTLSFVGPGYRHPDRAAFEVIARALADRSGSPILAALLRERAGSLAAVNYYGLEDAGMLYVALNPATPELSYTAAGAALQAISDLKKHGLKEADLKRYVDEVLREERERAEQLGLRAERLGEAALFGGVRYYWDLPEVYARLSPADVKRVADRYLVGENLRLVVLLPKKAVRLPEKGKEAFHRTLNDLGQLGDRPPPLFDATLHAPGELARIAAAAWGDPGTAAGFGPVERTVLENGLTLLVLEDHRHSLAAASLHLQVGSGDDPPGKEGLASLALRTLAADIASQTPTAASKQNASPRVQVETHVDRDLSELRFTGDEDGMQPGLERIGRALQETRVTTETLQEVYRPARLALDRAAADPRGVGLELFREMVYAGHAYAHAADGTRKGLAAITPDDLGAFRNTHIRPSRAFLAVVGDVDPAAVARTVRAAFHGWSEPPAGARGGTDGGDATPSGAGGDQSPSRPEDRATARARPGEYSRLLRGPRGLVLVGVPAVPILHADFPALRMIGTALTLQAFEELVFDRRAAFSAVSVPEGLRQGGFLAIEAIAAPDRLDAALFDVQRLIRQMALEPLSSDDMRDLNRMQIGKGLASVQGVRALAGSLSYREAAGLGADSYRNDFEASPVTAEHLRDLAETYFRPENWITVKVGPEAR